MPQNSIFMKTCSHFSPVNSTSTLPSGAPKLVYMIVFFSEKNDGFDSLRLPWIAISEQEKTRKLFPVAGLKDSSGSLYTKRWCEGRSRTNII